MRSEEDGEIKVHHCISVEVGEISATYHSQNGKPRKQQDLEGRGKGGLKYLLQGTEHIIYQNVKKAVGYT